MDDADSELENSHESFYDSLLRLPSRLYLTWDVTQKYLRHSTFQKGFLTFLNVIEFCSMISS